MTEKKVYSLPEIAQLLGISRNTAYRLAKEGKIPAIRIGERRLVVPVVALDKLLAGV